MWHQSLAVCLSELSANFVFLASVLVKQFAHVIALLSVLGICTHVPFRLWLRQFVKTRRQ
jgi:hypothetical protein